MQYEEPVNAELHLRCLLMPSILLHGRADCRVATESISVMPAQTHPFSCSCTYVNLDRDAFDCHPGINAVVFMQEPSPSAAVWIV